jgi:DNA-directed RNA polymerase specialized sigma24 family protein
VISDTHINYLPDAISVQNCEKSHKEFFVLLHDKLPHFARCILKSAGDAGEVVSGFFINTWQKRASFNALEKSEVANYCDA